MLNIIKGNTKDTTTSDHILQLYSTLLYFSSVLKVQRFGLLIYIKRFFDFFPYAATNIFLFYHMQQLYCMYSNKWLATVEA